MHALPLMSSSSVAVLVQRMLVGVCLPALLGVVMSSRRSAPVARPRRLSPQMAAVLITALATVAALLVAAPIAPAAAQQPSYPPGFDANGRMTLPVAAEPEYMLIAGDDRWQVRNRPQGTVAAAFGAPAGADDSRMSVSARHPNLGTATHADRDLVQVTHVRADGPATSLRNDYAVAVYSDGTAEVWGPKNAPMTAGSRILLDPSKVTGATSATRIVAGWMVGDVFGPHAAVLLNDGRIAYFRGENVSSRPIDDRWLDPDFGDVLAATFQEASAMNSPTQALTPRAHESNAVLAMVMSNGQVIVQGVKRESSGVTRMPFSGFYGHGGGDAFTQQLNNGIALIDIDHACFGLPEGGTPGDVARQIGCDPTISLGTVGQLGIAVGAVRRGQADQPIGREVRYIDVYDVKSVSGAYEGRYFTGHLCTTDVTHTGAFDIRAGYGRIIGGCVAQDQVNGEAFVGADRFALHVVQRPQYPRTYSEHAGGADGGGTPEVRSSSVVIPEATQVDVLAQPDASRGTFLAPTRAVTWTGVSMPTVQLQLTCEDVVGRPLPAAGGVHDSCGSWAPPSGQPSGSRGAPTRNNVTAVVAGYGTRSDIQQPSLFVSHRPADVQFSGDAARHSWTITPARMFETDAVRVRQNPATIDTSTLPLYTPPATLKAPVLTHVPRSTLSSITLEITNPQSRVETLPVAPIAVLQAPPTVSGLGQDAEDPPEFASSQSSGSTTSEVGSTRVGAHVEASMTALAGVGALGNNAMVGGGVQAGFSFLNEVEQQFDQAVTVTTTESYSGSYSDHTVVTESAIMDVWDARVIADPAGFSVGSTLEFKRPRAEKVVQGIPLSRLVTDHPTLYGEGGTYRPSLDLILGGSVIGNPGTYRSGVSETQPSSLLAANGGPCIGGYAAADADTPLNFGSPGIVDPTNPFFDGPPEPPKGPSILLSAVGGHAVSTGNSNREGSTIQIDEGSTSSLIATSSNDFSLSAIFQAKVETSVGFASESTLEVVAGMNAGWSTGSGVSRTLGTGSQMLSYMGNIPHSGPWAEAETYRWRMFMCEAPLGPLGAGQTVWVQGYLVDDYTGSGGLTDLAATTAVAPIDSAVVPADPAGTPTGAVTDCTTQAVDGPNFRWTNEAGTVQRYTVELENITAGISTVHSTDAWDWRRVPATSTTPARGGPREFNDTVRRSPTDTRSNVRPRPSCAAIGAAELQDGHLYRWRANVQGFVNNSQTSEWEFFRPQVVPSQTTFTVRQPIVHDDGSVTLDIENAPGVRSLRYDVQVFPAGDESEASRVARGQDVASRYRTPTLPPGRYVATIVGGNDHRDGSNAPILTDVQRVEFTVEETLQAQYSWTVCDAGPCPTGTAVGFTDQTRIANGVPIQTWRWDFGDGTTSTSPNPTHTFAAAPASGSYPVVLIVTDQAGRTDVLTQDVPVANRPPTLAPAITDGQEVVVDTELTMTSGAIDPDGPDDALIVEWNFGDGTTATGTSAAHTWSVLGPQTVQITATDELGATTVQQVQIEVVEELTAPPGGGGGGGGGFGGGGSGSGPTTNPDDESVETTEEDDAVTVDVPEDGQPVEVTVQTSAGPVTIVFTDLTAGGTVRVTPGQGSPPGLDPDILPLSGWFDIEVDGLAFASASVCVPHDDTTVPNGSTRLYHISGGTHDVTATVDDQQVCGHTEHFSPFVVGTPRVDRVAGPDRFATAAATSARTFDPGVDVAYVATGQSFPDALAAAPVAARDRAPVLLTARGSLPDPTRDELQRLAPSRIVILGGIAAVSTEVEAALREMADVERIAGADRFETAARLATVGTAGPVDVVHLATGEGFADALSAGPAAAALDGPVLLTARSRVPQATADALAELNPGRIVVLGGSAVVGDEVIEQLRADGWTVDRVAGPDRHATSAMVSQQTFEAGVDVVHIATAGDYPDALAGGASAGLLRGPVLLVDRGRIPEATLDALDRLAPARIVVLGGLAAVSDEVVAELRGRQRP